jgi:hypothetical protein
MTPASQRALAALARQNAVTITTLRQTAPLGGILLGILLIVAATLPFPRLPRQARSERLSGPAAACGAAPSAVR